MLPLSTITYRLLWAALLGSFIGIERSVRKRPAGMRTSLCVPRPPSAWALAVDCIASPASPLP